MKDVRIADLLRNATGRRSAVGAFNVVTLESAEAIVSAAEAVGSPVILMISQNTADYHGGLGALGAACLVLAEGASVPVAVQLDHAGSIEICRRAASIGIGSVMIDGSALPYAENIELTREVVRWAHDEGLSVEGELGHVAGKATDSGEASLTDPQQAAEFIVRTSVDALAVSVGTAHHMTEVGAQLDIARVAALRAAVPVPLVLHGSSGLDDEMLRAAVTAGIAKVNVGTHLNSAFTEAVRQALGDDPSMYDPRRFLGAGRQAIKRAVEEKLVVLERRGGAAA